MLGALSNSSGVDGQGSEYVHRDSGAEYLYQCAIMELSNTIKPEKNFVRDHISYYYPDLASVITKFNDERTTTHGKVIAMYDKAIQTLKKEI